MRQPHVIIIGYPNGAGKSILKQYVGSDTIKC
jgi:2-phosphoglycerate kinase